jgi:hypothetical protein
MGFSAELMRPLVAIAIAIVVTGCGPNNRSNPTSAEPKQIGPQFWKYKLTEYSIVENDVVRGPGGRWISVRYQLLPNETMTREQIVARITSALQSDGWKNEALPAGKYVLSKQWETSSEDLRFTRRAKPGEPDHWFFAQTVSVAEDAGTIAVYCEVGW